MVGVEESSQEQPANIRRWWRHFVFPVIRKEGGGECARAGEDGGGEGGGKAAGPVNPFRLFGAFVLFVPNVRGVCVCV